MNVNRFVGILGIVLGVLAVLSLLGSLWYWAIFGMSKPIGTAWVLTCTILAFASAGALAYWDIMTFDERAKR